MAENKIEIQIDAGIENFSKAITQADKLTARFTGNVVDGMQDASKSVQKLSNDVSGGLGGAMGKIAGGVAIGNLISKGVGVALDAVKGFAVESVRAYSEQEDALNKLSFALKASGDFSEGAMSKMKVFASNLQETSIYGDETALAMLALAKSFGATNDQATKLVQAGADLASKVGGSLEQRVEQLGKTFSGSAGKLGQFIPELKALTEAQLKAGDAIDIVARNTAGSASSAINSYSGTVTQLKNAYSDLQEEIGGFVANNSFLRDAIGVAKQALKDYTQSVVDGNIEQSRASGPIKETEETLGQLQRKLDELQTYKLDAEQIVINPDIWDKLFARTSAAAENIKRVSGEIDFFREQYKKAELDIFRSAEAEYKFPTKEKETGETSDQEKTDLANKLAVIEQRKAMALDFTIFEDQLRIDQAIRNAEFDATAYDQLIMHEQAKIDAIRDAELEKAKLIKDSGLRSQTEQSINQKAELDKLKTTITQKKRSRDEEIKAERAEGQAKLQIAQNFMSAGLAISKEGSLAQKALLIAQATMNTYMGATNALADTRPAYLAPAFAASMVAIGLAQVAKIAGAKFESGGIVGGNSLTGDKIGVQVNSSEMILNRQQQVEMFKQLNGQGSGGGTMQNIREVVSEMRSIPIIVQANGREIARLIRDEKASGFGV